MQTLYNGSIVCQGPLRKNRPLASSVTLPVKSVAVQRQAAKAQRVRRAQSCLMLTTCHQKYLALLLVMTTSAWYML